MRKIRSIEIWSQELKEKELARRGLAVYFALLKFGSTFFEWKIVKSGEPIEKIPSLIFALMYVPAVA